MRTLTVQPEQMYNGELILVNGTHPYRMKDQYKWFSRAHEAFPDIQLHRRAAAQLNRLISDLNGEDLIVPVSGYRDIHEQVDIYEECLRKDGVGYTTNFVAIPGCSEHHTGFAIDLAENSEEIDFICPNFPDTGICGQFRAQAADYGFIERYKEGRESITKVAKEPWHFRYVGVPHAKIIEEMDLTLEEYICWLKQFPVNGTHFEYRIYDTDYEIYYVPMKVGQYTELELREESRCQISGNNEDGIIVTVW